MGFFNTVIHQTLTNLDNADEVEQHGPYTAENISKTYLGAGYYFWDDHIELAHWWGEKHCKNNYFICEADFRIDRTLFFDLVGSRQDQQTFLKLTKRLNVQHLPIGQAIEVLKKVNGEQNGVFPYKAIRAIDIKRNTFRETILKFAKKRSSETSLTPKLIICIIDRSKVLLQNYKIIYPDNYV